MCWLGARLCGPCLGLGLRPIVRWSAGRPCAALLGPDGALGPGCGSPRAEDARQPLAIPGAQCTGQPRGTPMGPETAWGPGRSICPSTCQARAARAGPGSDGPWAHDGRESRGSQGGPKAACGPHWVIRRAAVRQLRGAALGGTGFGIVNGQDHILHIFVWLSVSVPFGILGEITCSSTQCQTKEGNN